jgi:hypothetical protein
MIKIGALVVLLTILMLVTPLRGVDREVEPCGIGDAQAMFQVLVIPVAIMRPRGIDQSKLVDSLSRCQYRLFSNGATYTFSEYDVFLGGIVWLGDYKARGITRQDAIAEIEATDDRVWMAELGPAGEIGELVEQPLMRTSYKTIPHPVFGMTVYQQRAFITQLPPGEYVSVWESTFQGAIETATVHLNITPAVP